MRIPGLMTILCWLLALAACGGSSDMGSVTTVNASCNPATIQSNGTSQCSFTLVCTGQACSTGVNWSATVGSINAAGLFTPPGTGASLKVTVTATSVFDPSRSGNTTVIVNPLTP